MPAVEVAIVLAGIESGLGFAPQQTDMPLLIEPPVSAHDQAVGGVFQGAVVLAINLAAMAQCLNPDSPGICTAGSFAR